MTEYVTGQIYGWNGGECPVHPESKVEVWFREGTKNLNIVGGCLYWAHSNDDADGDIIAFRVVTPYAEPKVIWVNEYASGIGSSYRTEEEAKRLGHRYNIRIAVKYVEVKE